MQIGYAHEHLDKLTLEELSVAKMNWRTRKFGFIARRVPTYSRSAFTVIGGSLFLNFVWSTTQPSPMAAAKALLGPDGRRSFMCSQTFPTPPCPLVAGIQFMVFAFIVFSGCRTRATQVPLPYL